MEENKNFIYTICEMFDSFEQYHHLNDIEQKWYNKIKIKIQYKFKLKSNAFNME